MVSALPTSGQSVLPGIDPKHLPAKVRRQLGRPSPKAPAVWTYWPPRIAAPPESPAQSYIRREGWFNECLSQLRDLAIEFEGDEESLSLLRQFREAVNGLEVQS